MTIDVFVNSHLQRASYPAGVATKPKTRGKSGAQKGVPKRKKRALDPNFSQRLDAAMQAKGYDVPRMAKNVGCTRAALHRLLKNNPKAVDAILLFEIATALAVDVAWLLFGRGSMTLRRELNPEESRALNTFALLSPPLRDLWLAQGEEIRSRQPALMPTEAEPFKVPVPHR